MNKLETINRMFEGKKIRSVWDSEKENYYFSVVDVINVLAEPKDASNYWTTLKRRLIKDEESKLPTNCRELKLKSLKDGKLYKTDCLDTKGILRLIESIPSPKAEPFKLWLASLGSERIDEVYDPSLAIDRAINYYRKKGYDDNWIELRLKGILNRKKLTDIWKEGGIEKDFEYAMLTDEIYKTWSGMTSREYKNSKGLTKESLRDNMSDIEVILTNLGEVSTRDIAIKESPKGLSENIKVARRGGTISKITKELYEKEVYKKLK